MGHTIHLFFPETWGFHIDLVTEDNVVAPQSIKVSSHSLDPSEWFSHVWCISGFFFPFFFYMTAQSFLILSSYRGSPIWLFPACFLSSFRVTVCFLVSLKHPFSWSDPRPQISNWSRTVAQPPIFSLLARHQWPLVDWGDVGCPGYRSVQSHIEYKQSWEFSGFQFLLDMSVLFALIKIPILLVPPHNFLLYLYCPDHIPV